QQMEERIAHLLTPALWNQPSGSPQAKPSPEETTGEEEGKLGLKAAGRGCYYSPGLPKMKIPMLSRSFRRVWGVVLRKLGDGLLECLYPVNDTVAAGVRGGRLLRDFAGDWRRPVGAVPSDVLLMA